MLFSFMGFRATPYEASTLPLLLGKQDEKVDNLVAASKIHPRRVDGTKDRFV